MILNQRGEPQASTRDLTERVAWFKRLLESADIGVHSNSPLWARLGDMETIGRAWDGAYKAGTQPSIPDFLRSALGMDYQLRALQRAERFLDPKELKSALLAFTGQDVLMMTDTVARRGNRDRAWELVVACIAAPSVRNLHLGGNSSPDIEFDYDGMRFGIECKMLNSQKPRALVDAVVSGAKQIEQSRVEYGAVVVNSSFLIPHAKMDPENSHQMFQSHQEASSAIESMLESRANHLKSSALRTRLTADAGSGRARLKTRKVLLVAQTVVLVASEPVTITSVSSLNFRAFALPICESFKSAFRRNTLLIG